MGTRGSRREAQSGERLSGLAIGAPPFSLSPGIADKGATVMRPGYGPYLTILLMLFLSGPGTGGVVAADAASPKTFCEALRHGLEVSDDPEYGYTPEKPILVGGGLEDYIGHQQRWMYLDLLLGPKGKPLKYERIGIGGFYRSDHALIGKEAPIDKIEIRSKGMKRTYLYMSLYDHADLRIPQGLTIDDDLRQRFLAPGGWCFE